MASQRDWDAVTYHQVALPHERWAQDILDRLPLRGDEVVLDAGCGSGRATRLLLERLPRGRVYGVDRSPAMLSVARAALAPYGDRVRLVEADLLTVTLPEPVDVVFSNATFHWIRDHAALFANLARLLRPGGWLAAQCGGAGNIAHVMACADRALRRPSFAVHATARADAWTYAGPEETRARLEAAGFTDVAAWLEPQPVRFDDVDAFARYLKTVVLGPYLDVLPATLHDAFAAAVVDEDATAGAARTVDYVRLNMTARRAPLP